jgi:hypothetical protein
MSGDESPRVRTASLYTALWEKVSVSGLKIKVARYRLIRSSASPVSADQAPAVGVGPEG